ncbi:MAG: branched-chain amino acid aminotransferase [Saprospiraceae bacterium]|nr:branched-chain amino acid aminotransferase [Saprospiraceae bacterium]
MMEIRIDKVKLSKLPQTDLTKIPFGRVFTDHMFIMEYKNGSWQNARIEGVRSIPMHPANLTLHYGQSIFEGMKASKNEDGVPLLFRADMHAARMNASAKRMCMPTIDPALFVEAVRQLVSMERDWIPGDEGSALYIRPFMFATDEFLGVAPSESYVFIILTLPVAPYYSHPVKLLASTDYIRAAKGGVGEAKTAGNYAASLLASKEAKQKGFDQVLWLDGRDFKYVQEVGTMNIFFVINDKVITPPTDGAILKGITRDSFLHILKDKGYAVEIRPISMDEVVEAYQNDQLQEVFGAGTAAVAVDVQQIGYKDHLIELNPRKDSLAQLLKKEINGLRSGKIEDRYGWTEPVYEVENV